MNLTYQLWSRLSRQSQRGQTMAEYGLILALVAIVAVGAWSLLGTKISTVISSIANNL
jgi:Flp pilus assembly pilin Flp